jgi:hypothetical protein
MRRLIIRSSPLENREFPLQPGTIHIGRAFGNDIQIEEPSVSSSHCEIVVGDDAVTIIDLNSTNGTFVNQAQVQSARLKAGDAVQLGNVECVFVADVPMARPVVRIAAPKSTAEPLPVGMPSPPAIRIAAPVGLPPEPPRIAPPLPPPVVPPGVPEAAWCKNHPKNPALYYCTKCRKAFCELCVAVRHTGHVPTHHCRLCASDCAKLAKLPQPREVKITNFYTALPEAFTYPFKADGMVLLTVGTLFYLIMHYAAFVSRYAGLIGLVSIVILTLFGGGVLFSFMKGIITSTAGGSNALPDWPDVSEWAEDIVMPFGQMLGTLVFSFLPVVALFATEVSGFETAWWMWAVALLLGCMYYPMGLLSVAMHDTVAGLNPLLVVVSIYRVTIAYAVCCGVLLTVFVLRLLIVTFLPAVILIPIIPTIIAGFISLYLLTVLMRILGLLYLAKQEELGWFNR